MPPTRAVFFDLDGTLIDDEASSRACIERTCLQFQACAPGFDRVRVAEAYYDLGKAFWSHRVHSGIDGGRQYRVALWNDALQLSGINSPALALDLATFYGQQRASTAIAFDDSAPVLRSLRDAGYRIAVITNGIGSEQRDKLAIAGLSSWIDTVIASTDIGAGKPDLVVFEAALKATGVEAFGTWHIGDNLGTDVAGALNAGLKAAWLNRNGGEAPPDFPDPDAEIFSLTELLPLLGIEAIANG